LRQNNTGKLLWQVFGVEAASLCLFGIQEHEDIMWDAFQRSGNPKTTSDKQNMCIFAWADSFLGINLLIFYVLHN
jgi:hypothetical protein